MTASLREVLERRSVHAHFVNTLRSCIGLDPIQEIEPTSNDNDPLDRNLAQHEGSGNYRHVGGGKVAL